MMRTITIHPKGPRGVGVMLLSLSGEKMGLLFSLGISMGWAT